jgi:hypothetical protein
MAAAVRLLTGCHCRTFGSFRKSYGNSRITRMLQLVTLCLVCPVSVFTQRCTESSNVTTTTCTPTTASSNDQCLLQEGLSDLRDCRISRLASCRNKCGQLVTHRYKFIIDQTEQRCACDHFCNIFGNCCVDFETECPDIANATHGNNSSGLNAILDYDIKCDVVGGFSNRLNEYLMVSTCPPTWTSDETRQACENRNSLQLFDFLPVTHIESGLHFRNVHCSRCHGLISGVELWSMSLMCSSVDPASMVTPERLDRAALSDETCQIFFDSKHASQPRRCQRYESTCHPDVKVILYYIVNVTRQYVIPIANVILY